MLDERIPDFAERLPGGDGIQGQDAIWRTKALLCTKRAPRCATQRNAPRPGSGQGSHDTPIPDASMSGASALAVFNDKLYPRMLAPALWKIMFRIP